MKGVSYLKTNDYNKNETPTSRIVLSLVVIMCVKPQFSNLNFIIIFLLHTKAKVYTGKRLYLCKLISFPEKNGNCTK